MVALQAAPLLLLVALLLSGRAGPVAAVLAALAAAVPAVIASLPAGAQAFPFLVEETLRGAFLALKPIGVVAGGLLFHVAVVRDAAPEALVRPWRTAAYIAGAVAVVELLLLIVIGGGALVGAVSDRVGNGDAEGY